MVFERATAIRATEGLSPLFMSAVILTGPVKIESNVNSKQQKLFVIYCSLSLFTGKMTLIFFLSAL